MRNKESERKYRHEYKFLIDRRQEAILNERLRNLIPLDSHTNENGKYWIRSAYFDDMYDRCYNENDAGVNERAKYRIRIYNGNSDRITLEKKSKSHGMTHKDSVVLSKKQFDDIMRWYRKC